MMRKRFAFLGVLALVLVLVFPGRADAIDFMPKGVIYQGDVGNGNYGAVVAAYNQYDAACYVLGKNPDSISATIKQKLSDPDYGGRFYDYAQSFFTQSGMLEDIPGWVPTYIVWGSELMDLTLSDYQSVWYSTATKTGHDDALEDLVRILLGEDLGGGGSGGNVTGYSLFELRSGRTTIQGVSSNSSAFKCTYYNAVVDSDGNVTLTGGQGTFSDVVGVNTYVSSVRLYVSPSVRSYVQSLGKEYCFIVGVNGSNDTVTAGFVFGDDLVISRHVHPNASSVVRDFVEGSNLRYWRSSPMSAYHDSSGVFVVMPDVVPSDIQPVSTLEPSFYSSFIAAPAPPDGDWPEPTTPVTPDPPEVPTPTAPTVEPGPVVVAPTVTWPDIDITVNPPSVVVPSTPEGQDYTQLLTLINDNLSSIDAYLQNFYSSFNSFRSDFLNGIDDIVDGLRNIYQYLGHLNNILEVHCKHITDQIEESVYNLELYIKRLFEWLPKQLDFDAQYDDSAVTTLLYRILNKIPGGSGSPITYKPNPQSDEPGFFDFLADLWHRFLLDLVSVLPDALGGLVDDISQLTHYFPFSIPWDMFALLALFAHEPVTPVFDVPWGYGGGEGEIQMIRVDLSAWDGVMETVRPVFLVGFCMQLAMITKDLLANFDLKQGGV